MNFKNYISQINTYITHLKAKNLAMMVNYVMIMETGLEITCPISLPFSLRRFVTDSGTALTRVILPVIIFSTYRKIPETRIYQSVSSSLSKAYNWFKRKFVNDQGG